MIHTDRFVMKPQLVGLTASVLHLTAVLLLQTHSCGGQSQMIGPSQPVVAMVGDDIILPCQLEPAVDAYDLTVEWARPDLDPRFVHFRRDGVELQPEEHQSYRGRTSLFNNKLKHGDVSLKVSKVGLSDAGTYRCLIPTINAKSMVELVVVSVSSPGIKISRVSSGVLLEFKSKGWYPEPDVFWLDGEDKLLSAGPTETVRGPDGLYTVISRVTVEKTPSNSFTCRVKQKNINQTRETQIQIPDDLFMVQSSSAVRITICVVVCVMAIVAVSLMMWKGRRNKTETNNTNNTSELQGLMEAERDRERLMTESEKIRYLDNTKAKLDEELQKTEGDLQHVQQVIKTLTEQKEDLRTQRDKLLLLQKEEETKIEEKTKDRDTKTRLLNEDKKLKKHDQNIHDLKKKKEEHEKLVENTEKLQKTTEDLIIKMTERKAKLERDVEQINRFLTETKRQTEESQRKLETERQREESQSVQLEQSETKEERNDPPSNDPE